MVGPYKSHTLKNPERKPLTGLSEFDSGFEKGGVSDPDRAHIWSGPTGRINDLPILHFPIFDINGYFPWSVK